MEKKPEPQEANADNVVQSIGAEAVGDRDVAVAMVGEEGHAVDPVVVRRAIRKIDWFLIPAMTVGCEFGSLLIRESHTCTYLIIILRWACIL